MNEENGKYFKSLICLESNKNVYKVSICVCNFHKIDINEEPDKFLHHEEMNQLKGYKFRNRIESFLMGRYAAKMALSLYLGRDVARSTAIKNGLFHQPYFVGMDTGNLQVSITHCDGIGAAIVFPEDSLMGLDIENIDRVKKSGFRAQITESERCLVEDASMRYSLSEEELIAFLWSAKESLSKILKTGLTIPFEVLEIDELNYKEKHLSCSYKNFIQYCSISIRQKGYLLSIAYPKELEWINGEEFLLQLNRGSLL